MCITFGSAFTMLFSLVFEVDKDKLERIKAERELHGYRESGDQIQRLPSFQRDERLF